MRRLASILILALVVLWASEAFAQDAAPDTVIVREGGETVRTAAPSQAAPAGVARVRGRIAQIRGQRAPAQVVYVYPDGTPVPPGEVARLAPEASPSAREDGRATELLPPAQQGQALDRRGMTDLMRQMDRRFERLGDRLDDMEDLYFQALQQGRQGGTTVILPDGRRALVLEEGEGEELDELPRLSEDEGLAPSPRTFDRLTPPRLRPGVDRIPRADLPPRAQEVERALLDTGLFRTIEIVFEFDRSDILDGSERTLDAIGTVLELNPDLRVEVAGHTDSIGSEEYNQRLSERRAASVRAYLIENFSIDEDRLVSVGYGELRPIFSNETPTGRTLNRRVEFEVLDNG